MQDTLDKVIEELRQREEVTLGPPCTEEDINGLTSELGYPPASEFMQMYSAFNGAQYYFDLYYFDLWPVEQVIKEMHQSVTHREKTYTPIGDTLIFSDLVMACLSDANEPVLLLYDMEEFAPNLEALLKKMASAQLP